MTSKLTRDRLAEIAQFGFSSAITPANDFEIKELARMALAALDSEPVRSPVLAYADSYRDMAKQGVESVPIWSVITDLERNIAPLYRRAQPVLEIESEPVFTLEVARADYKGQKLGNHFGFITLDAARELKEGNYQLYTAQPAPVVPDDVLDALQKVARIRLDLNDFDGDRRGIADCLCDAEEALIEVVNRRAAMLQAGDTVRDLSTPVDPQVAEYEQNVMQDGNSPVIPDTWIPVSERMPPSRHEVLVGRWWGEKPRWCCKWATYIPGHPDAQSSGWLIPGASWTPTHWMPLPAAPQEVK
ncbi:DUF551 domain-containing protein [Klebsiella pneumoniae]